MLFYFVLHYLDTNDWPPASIFSPIEKYVNLKITHHVEFTRSLLAIKVNKLHELGKVNPSLEASIKYWIFLLITIDHISGVDSN